MLKPPPQAVAHLPVTDDARRGDDRGVVISEVNLFELSAEAGAYGRVRDLVQTVQQQERLALAEFFPQDGLEGGGLGLRHLRLAQGVEQYVVQRTAQAERVEVPAADDDREPILVGERGHIG